MAKRKMQSFYCRVPLRKRAATSAAASRFGTDGMPDPDGAGVTSTAPAAKSGKGNVSQNSTRKSPPSDMLFAVGATEAFIFPGPMVLDGLAKGKINDWPAEYQPLLRLLRSRKPVPRPLPLDLVPPDLRAVFGFPVLFPKKEEEALAIAKFIEERMPLGRTRKGVPKNVIADAKKRFGLSVRAIQRAFHRGKKRKKLLELLGLEYPRALP